MQTLRLNGMNPICKPRRIKHSTLPLPQKPAASLFSPPQPAEVKRAPSADGSGLPGGGPLIRHARDAENQRLYDVSRPLAASRVLWQIHCSCQGVRCCWHSLGAVFVLSLIAWRQHDCYCPC